MQEIVDALKSVEKRLGSIDKTLVLQKSNLEEHMRRTEILEDEIDPIKAHVEQVKGAGKLLGILSLVATIAGAIYLTTL